MTTALVLAVILEFPLAGTQTIATVSPGDRLFCNCVYRLIFVLNLHSFCCGNIVMTEWATAGFRSVQAR